MGALCTESVSFRISQQLRGNVPNLESCTDCGHLLEAGQIVNGRHIPCPACGSVRRTIGVTTVESVIARDGLEVKAKRLGQKKPYWEARSVPSFSVAKQKLVQHDRIIDRDEDKYSERVTDYESGAVIHESTEQLSDHRGHGSAKKRAPR